MFNNKKDPLLDSVKRIRDATNIRLEAEIAVNEAFGITSKKALPNELIENYEKILRETESKMLDMAKNNPADKKVISESIQGDLHEVSKGLLIRYKKKAGRDADRLRGEIQKSRNAVYGRIASTVKPDEYQKINDLRKKLKSRTDNIDLALKKKKAMTESDIEEASAIQKRGIKKLAKMVKNKKQRDREDEKEAWKKRTSIESLKEEIKNSLIRRLYEAQRKGEDSLIQFAESLSPEQIDILGLDEDVAAQKPLDALASRAWQGIKNWAKNTPSAKGLGDRLRQNAQNRPEPTQIVRPQVARPPVAKPPVNNQPVAKPTQTNNTPSLDRYYKNTPPTAATTQSQRAVAPKPAVTPTPAPAPTVAPTVAPTPAVARPAISTDVKPVSAADTKSPEKTTSAAPTPEVKKPVQRNEPTRRIARRSTSSDSNRGGSFSSYPGWAQKAFNPDSGG